MRPQAAKRITNHASQTPGHVHLAEYSPTSVTRNSHLRRIPGADLTVAGLVLPLAHAMPCSCTKTFPVGQASNTCVPPAEDEAIERLLVRVNLRPKRRTYDRCSWRYRDRWHHRVGDCCTRDPLLRSALDPKWTGSHWTFAIVAVLVVVSLVTIGVQDTNLAISIATLLMVFVLQNTQNRDSAALHQTGRDDPCRTRCPRGRARHRGHVRSRDQGHDAGGGGLGNAGE
jgi:hypothetical protein